MITNLKTQPHPHADFMTQYVFDVDPVLYQRVFDHVVGLCTSMSTSGLPGPIEEDYDRDGGWAYYLHRYKDGHWAEVCVALSDNGFVLTLGLDNEHEGDDAFDGTIQCETPPHQWLDALAIIRNLTALPPVEAVT